MFDHLNSKYIFFDFIEGSSNHLMQYNISTSQIIIVFKVKYSIVSIFLILNLKCLVS